MAFAIGDLTVREKTLRNDEMKIVLGPGHGHIEQAPLLFEFGCGARAEIRWQTAVNDIEDEDRPPFLALGGMDGREDEIIIIKQWHAGVVTGRVRWIEGQFRQEPLTGWITPGDLLELN